MASTRSSALLLAVLLGLGAGLGSARANASTPTCAPVRPVGDVVSLPEPYRDAIAELVEATSHPGKPWSCSGGTIEIVMASNGHSATLSVVDASGRAASRAVEGPEDLRAVGEALLAAPLIAEAPPLSPPIQATSPPSIQPVEHPAQNPPPTPARTEPRLLIEALAGPRGSSPFPTLWMSGELRGSVPIDDFRVGIFARLALPLAYEDHPPRRHFSEQEVTFGLSVGRVIVHGPFELSARFDPSFAVVTAEAGHESDPGHELDEEGARVGLRLGLGIVGKLRLSRLFRAVIVLDGNLAPLGIANNTAFAPDLPLPPVYTFGLSLGAEAVIQ